MIQAIRKAYGAGWRAGMAGQVYLTNPFSNIFLRVIWDAGWQTGTKRSLTLWLKKRSGVCL